MNRTSLAKMLLELPCSFHPGSLHRLFPIFGTHVGRIGYVRVIMGGIAMYLSLPFLAIFHVLVVSFLLDKMIHIAFGAARIEQKNFIIIDRHKIKDLPWLDRLNCVYCGYANGLALLFDARLSQVRLICSSHLNGWRIKAWSLTLLLCLPYMLVFSIHGYVIYDLVVSRVLGMHRLSFKQAFEHADIHFSPANGNVFTRILVCYMAIENERLTNSLEQIESSWCPLRHLHQGEKAVYPAHHDSFFEPNQIKQMIDALARYGSVSARKTRW